MTSGDLALAIRAIGALVVVLGAVLLVARMARRHSGRRGESGLRVVQRIGLSRDASIAIVEVGGQALVVGVTAHGISMLSSTEKGSLDGDLLRAALIAGHDMARAQIDTTISKETATMTSTDESRTDTTRTNEPLVDGGYARRNVLARPSTRATVPPTGGLEAYPDLASVLRAAGMTTTGTVMPALEVDESQLRGRKGVQHSAAGLAAEKIKAATMAWVASLPRAQYVSPAAAVDAPPADFALALEAERASMVEDVEPDGDEVSPVVSEPHLAAPDPVTPDVAKPDVAEPEVVTPEVADVAVVPEQEDDTEPDVVATNVVEPDVADAPAHSEDAEAAAPVAVTAPVIASPPIETTPPTQTTPPADTTESTDTETTDTETENESTMSDDEQIVAAQAHAAARALSAVRALHAEAAAAEQRAEAELAAGATQAMQARQALQALGSASFGSTPASTRSERRRGRRQGPAEIVLPQPTGSTAPAVPTITPFSVDLREPATNAFGQSVEPARHEQSGAAPDTLHVEGPNHEALIVSRLAQVAAEHSAAERDHTEQLELLRERLESQRITVEAAASLQARLEANVLEQMTLMQTQAERQRQTEEALRAEYDRLETERISQEAAEAARHRLAMGVLEQMKVMQARLDAQRAAEDAERVAREELIAEAARVERLKKEAEVMEQMRVMQERLDAQRAIDEADRLRTEAENLRVEAEILAQMQQIQERIEGTRTEEPVAEEPITVESVAVESVAVEATTIEAEAVEHEAALEQDVDDEVAPVEDDDADLSFDSHLTGASRPQRRRLGGLLELAGRRS